jgi:hypothetical protein
MRLGNRYSLDMRFATAIVASILCNAAHGQQITFESLLHEMGDRAVLARFPDPGYSCKQFSSYDRRSISPADQEGWFANNDAGNFLRTENRRGRTEYVMADMDGPGAVVRIWSANPKGTLRIYLDREPEPVFEAPMADLLAGKFKFNDYALDEAYAGVRARGYNLYLPILYAEHCTITSDEGGFYYHVNYRTYERGADVQTFNRQVAQRIAAACAAARNDIVGIPSPPATLGHLPEIAPGDHVDFQLAEGGSGAVNVLVAQLDAKDYETASQTTVLELTFDDNSTVWAPFGAFFGGGVGMPEVRDFARYALGNECQSIWVMPFRRSAKATLWNYGTEPIRAKVVARTGPWQWDNRSMYFHARWRAQHGMPVSGGRGTADWNYIEVDGPGVLVGDTLTVMNPVGAWWGEGDEKIYVDGERFPSHFGTGTEDYYGYAWCSNEPFHHYFHAQPRCDGRQHGNNWGCTTVSRIRSLDAIPFDRSLKFDMELWHWAPCDMSYSATTFFYGRPATTHNRPADPKAAATPMPKPPPLPPPFKIEAAIECEDLKITGRSPGLQTQRQDMRAFAAGKWSGEEHLWVQARSVGDYVELEVPAPGDEPVAVALHSTRSWDYATVRLSINGQPSPAGDVDLFSGGPGRCVPSGALNLGVFAPAEGKLRLRAEVVGKNAASQDPGMFFGLDCVVLTKPTAGAVAPGHR